MLAAVLSCHRDHVAFVDQEVAGGSEWVAKAVVAPEVAAVGLAQMSTAAGREPAERPFDRLRQTIKAKSKDDFHDVRKPSALMPSMAPEVGYIGEYEGRTEYRIFGSAFRRIAGGLAEERALKQELFERGLIVTDRRGDGISYVVKRPLPNGTRPFFVVLRANPKR